MRTQIYGSNLRNDTLVATGTIRETFYGQGGNDVFVFHNGEPPFFDQDFSDRFIGGSGNDRMTGLDVGFNDYTKYAGLSFDGGAGKDSVEYVMTGSIGGEAIDVKLSKFKTLELSVEHHRFDIAASVTDGASSTFALSGTKGAETVRLVMTPSKVLDLDSDVGVSIALGAGNDRFEFVGQQRIHTALDVNSGNGNDTIIINDTTTENSSVSNTRILTGKGDDTVVLEGMHKEKVNLGAGHDTIYVLTGNFAEKPDAITTGKNADSIYLELDEYSQVANVKDFDPDKDILVFDAAEDRDTSVTFKAKVAAAASDPKLYMDNAAGDLWFGDNLLVHFSNGAVLTEANFTTGDFLF